MTEGWAVPEYTRYAHYFPDDHSLCRKWSPAPVVLREDPPSRVCGPCRKSLAVRRAVGPVERVRFD